MLFTVFAGGYGAEGMSIMGNLRLAASIQSWAETEDETFYAKMQELGYTGLEVMPERVFPEETYAHLTGATLFTGYLYQSFGLKIAGLSPVLRGLGKAVTNPIDQEMQEDAIAAACRFAASCHCNTLVMECDTLPEERFLNTCGLLASQYNCTLVLEPKAGLSVLMLCRYVKMLGIPGLAVCLNVGTMLAGSEKVAELIEYLPLISHVRICEPDLGAIQPHSIHRELALLLKGLGYQGWITVQMNPADAQATEKSLAYVAETFV